MNHQAERDETGFLARAQDVFAASLSTLEPDVLARLRAARQHAVAAAGRPEPLWRAHPWALPASATALLGAVLIGGIVLSGQEGEVKTPLFAAENGNDMAIVLSNDNLDMYADMDFYRWLQAQQQNQNDDNSGKDNNG